MRFKMWSNESGDFLTDEVNEFLEDHPDIEIMDYKMTTSYYFSDYSGRGAAQYQVGLFYKEN